MFTRLAVQVFDVRRDFVVVRHERQRHGPVSVRLSAHLHDGERASSHVRVRASNFREYVHGKERVRDAYFDVHEPRAFCGG